MRAPGSRLLALAAAIATTILVGPARADLPRPPGYVEKCTMEKQAKPGTECLGCAAYHGNYQHCEASLASYGFAQSCRSGGASVWSEVWCRAARPEAPKVPEGVLAQLGDANGHPPAAPVTTAAPVATAAPVPPPALQASPLPSASAAPRPDANGPAPQPVPLPPGGCGCMTGGAEVGLPALMLAISAAAAGIARRRRSRR